MTRRYSVSIALCCVLSASAVTGQAPESGTKQLALPNARPAMHAFRAWFFEQKYNRLKVEVEASLLNPENIAKYGQAHAQIIESIRTADRFVPRPWGQLRDMMENQIREAKMSGDEARAAELRKALPPLSMREKIEVILKDFASGLASEDRERFEFAQKRWTILEPEGQYDSPIQMVWRAVSDPKLGMSLEEGKRMVADIQAAGKDFRPREHPEQRPQMATTLKEAAFKHMTPEQRRLVEENIARFERDYALVVERMALEEAKVKQTTAPRPARPIERGLPHKASGRTRADARATAGRGPGSEPSKINAGQAYELHSAVLLQNLLLTTLPLSSQDRQALERRFADFIVRTVEDKPRPLLIAYKPPPVTTASGEVLSPLGDAADSLDQADQEARGYFVQQLVSALDPTQAAGVYEVVARWNQLRPPLIDGPLRRLQRGIHDPRVPLEDAERARLNDKLLNFVNSLPADQQRRHEAGKHEPAAREMILAELAPAAAEGLLKTIAWLEADYDEWHAPEKADEVYAQAVQLIQPLDAQGEQPVGSSTSPEDQK